MAVTLTNDFNTDTVTGAALQTSFDELASAVSQIGPEDISGTPVIARIIEDVPAKDLKGLADEFMGQIGSGVVALISTEGGKASIVAAVGPDHQDRHNAVELVRAASAAVGGKGGGFVYVKVNGQLNIESGATIAAEGEKGGSGYTSTYAVTAFNGAGGGSGGSVQIHANNIIGGGGISA